MIYCIQLLCIYLVMDVLYSYVVKHGRANFVAFRNFNLFLLCMTSTHVYRLNWRTNHIGGAIVSVLASTVVTCGFEPRLGKTKDCKIGICCFSAKRVHWWVRAETYWLGIRIKCPRGATCLDADCCVSELALQKANQTY